MAIGLSSGFLEPLESTSIHLIQRGVIGLMQMFPAAGIRSDVAFWRDCRSMDVPASLRHRIRLFSETARVFRGPNELFAVNSWIQVMLGQGITPEQHHPVADLMGDAELTQFLEDIRSGVNRTVAQLPMHQDYVARYCNAPGTERAAGRAA